MQLTKTVLRRPYQPCFQDRGPKKKTTTTKKIRKQGNLVYLQVRLYFNHYEAVGRPLILCEKLAQDRGLGQGWETVLILEDTPSLHLCTHQSTQDNSQLD